MTMREFNRYDIDRAIKGFYGLPDNAQIDYAILDWGTVSGAMARFEGEVGSDPNKITSEDITSLRALITEENQRLREDHNQLIARMKAMMQPKEGELLQQGNFSALEIRIAALFEEYRTHIRRDTRGECKKLRVKVQEDGQERDDSLQAALNVAFEAVNKDLAAAVTGGCQKALVVQIEKLSEAASQVEARAASGAIKIAQPVSEEKDQDLFPVGLDVSFKGVKGKSEDGRIAPHPRAPTGFDGRQYYIRRETGGAFWKDPEDVRPRYAR